MQEIIWSEKAMLKLLGAQFEDITKRPWIVTWVQWVIDSKLRTKVWLQDFIKNQLEYPDNDLIELAKKLKGKSYDETVFNIEKYVYQNFTYMSDKINYGMDEYWAEAKVTVKKKLGDCFSGDTKIIVKRKNDNLICLKSFYELKKEWKNYLALSYNFEKKESEFKPIVNFIEKGFKTTYRVKNNCGKDFLCTKDHKLYCQINKNNIFNWKKLEDINMDSKNYWDRNLACVLGMPEGDISLSEELCNLIGSYVADGWSENSHFCISGDNPKRQNKLKLHLEKLGINYSESKRKVHSYISILNKDTPIEFIELIKSMGQKGSKKRFPDIVMKCNYKTINKILYYYGERDGTHKDKKVITYSTVSNKLAEQIRLILKQLGIHYSIYQQIQNRDDCNRLPIYRIEVKSKGKIFQNQLEKNHIRNISPSGIERVYDLTIQDNHNFVLEDGVLAHNCDDLNGLVYVLCRLAGVPRYLMFCAIGDTNVGGHFWCIYFNPHLKKRVKVDVTYEPQIKKIQYKSVFHLSALKYKEIWFLFNDENSYKIKQ